MNHDTFISYSSQNKDTAQAICHVLEQNGIRCWIAPRDIPAGSQYGDIIDNAIKECKVVIVLFSETAAISPWVNGELNIAFEEQKTIIPFRLDKTPLKGQARLMLNQKHWIDAYPDYKTKFNDLVSAVAMALGRTEEAQKPTKTSFRKKILSNKQLIFLITSLLIISFALIYFTEFRQPTYEYNRNNINIKIKNINKKQSTILTDILDGMIFVNGGSFIMGLSSQDSLFITENDNRSLPNHKVTLSNYYISKYELTQKQWTLFSETDEVTKESGANKPVDFLSWDAAMQYIEALSSLTGLNFSLPTEAQWEYAARGGTLSHNYIYSGSNEFLEAGWLRDADASIHEVGQKMPNELGLYDMTGNVQEFCLDYYAKYTSYSEANPQGPTIGTKKIVRGGSITSSPFDAKNSSRSFCEQSFNCRSTGMRLVININ